MKEKHQNVPASYLILFENNKVLLLRRFNTNYEDDKYSVIAGHVEQGESFTQCMIREAHEEIGIKIAPEDLRFLHLMHRDSKTESCNERVDVFFSAIKWTGDIVNKEPHKCDDLSWFDINHLPENTIPYIHQVIEKIKAKDPYSEYGW